ncbi:MAG TPA: hypothetical protein VK102_01240, partial [Sphingobacterium sp.]|nr:hypothetical protein [Sphingobacterium sp.]
CIYAPQDLAAKKKTNSQTIPFARKNKKAPAPARFIHLLFLNDIILSLKKCVKKITEQSLE